MEAQAQEHERRIVLSTGDQALNHAISAADSYMRAAQRAATPAEKARLSRKCNELIALAERLKANAKLAAATSRPPVPESTRQLPTSEKTLILRSSRLHGKVFPPWAAAPDPSAFDRAGSRGSEFLDDTVFSLSEEQRTIFAGWKRPGELVPSGGNSGQGNLSDHLMNAHEDCDLAQDLATDCSVVASLAAAMRHLGPPNHSLLPGLMYPFDAASLRPVVSPNGKYIFRMYFNGCWRQVVIDDRLPSSSTGRTIYVVDKRNPFLVWPALIEKAYLKIRGGYDFPGSNSGTDLHALTGWIPEQIFFQAEDIDLSETWHRIEKAYSDGDAFLTLGTGNISPEEQETLGLVKEHDYAVLDMKIEGGNRLLLVKNPWCDSLVWTGAGSSATIQTHTPGSSSAADREGMHNTFWISCDDVSQHFESLYVNWNPALFKHRQDHHFAWEIPSKTVQSALTHNPQFSVKAPTVRPIWILLSRHWQDGELEILRKWKARQDTDPDSSSVLSTKSEGSLATVAKELGFMSLGLFQTSPAGTRVPVQAAAQRLVHLGPYVDSPNTLLRFDNPVPNQAYTAVVLQTGLPLPKYSFTLSFFSDAPLAVSPAAEPHAHHAAATGSWTRRTAGGSAAHASYARNPQFALSVPSRTPLSLLLSTDGREHPVHVALLFSGGGQRVTALAGRDVVASSPEYQRGCATARAAAVEPGTYTVVCSTYEPGQLGDFALRVGADAPVALRPVLADAAGRMRTSVAPLRFRDGERRRRAQVGVGRLTRASVAARADPVGGGGGAAPCAIRVALELGTGVRRAVLAVSGEGEFQDAALGLRTEDVDADPEAARMRGGLWLVVEQIGDQRAGHDVHVEMLSDGPLQVGPWQAADED